MDVRNLENNKKTLEKNYNKLLDTESREPQLTQEGLMLCQQLDINPTDIYIRTLEYFKKNDGEPDEVVQIRFDHYKQRRYSK